MGLTKSHSNYVVKKLHQPIKDGVVYERDITTIGSRDNFAKGQVPMYRSGNFVITTNTTSNGRKNISKDKWETNGDSEIWTLENITTKETEERDIVLKTDFSRFTDFCYYGSCVEMVRSSVAHIMSIFPGELYVPNEFGEGIHEYYTTGPVSNPNLGEFKPLGGEDKFLMANPFGINIHSNLIDKDEYDKLKYFVMDGYLNYEVIEGNGEPDPITEWNSETVFGCAGDKVADITIKTLGGKEYSIEAYANVGGGYVYLVGQDMVDKEVHIRPKAEFYDKFIKSLDGFEEALLDTTTEPIYKSTFEVEYETDDGIAVRIEDFVFPIGDGGYNIGSNDATFKQYADKLMGIAGYYDENYCDNLVRCMTHEAISNLEDKLNRYDDDGEMVVYDTNRIIQILRVCGREFDDIKTRIDNIARFSTVTYDGKNNVPDELLSDLLSDNEGWDIKNVGPYELSVKEGKNLFSRKAYECVKAYSLENLAYPYGYYASCSDCGEGGGIKHTYAEEDAPNAITDCDGKLRMRTKQYSNEHCYDEKDMNTHFLRMLKLNSRSILRKKGTIEGIEEMLSLFGMKSKRWVESLDDGTLSRLSDTEPDYSITEYTSFTNGIDDKYSERVGMNKLDWYNYTKDIAYDTEDYKNGRYLHYQGLPVAYKTLEDGTNRLYPYFNRSENYDGRPHYQMDGGWMRRTKVMFDKDDNIVSGLTNMYKETLNTTRTVDDLGELFSVPYTALHDGEIYFVRDITGVYAVIDGIAQRMNTEYDGDDELHYVYGTIRGGRMLVGNTVYEGTVSLYNPYNGDYSKILLNSEDDGTTVKIFMVGDELGISSNSTENESVFFYTNVNDGHYFRINNAEFRNELSDYGWEQLAEDDTDRMISNSVVDYFKGNNPHTGYGRYDGGYRYMRNFMELFNFPLEKGLFSSRCYVDDKEPYDTAVTENIPMVGFRNLKTDTDECSDGYYLGADSKIHYFGDFSDNEGNVTSYGEGYSLTDIRMAEDGDKYGSSVIGKEDGNDLGDGSLISGAEVDDCTHQIVNTKVMGIKFFMKSKDELSKEWMEEAKYLDSVVLPYLEQMVPPTTICNVEYVAGGKTYARPIDYIIIRVIWDEESGDDLDISVNIPSVPQLADTVVGWYTCEDNAVCSDYIDWTDDNRGCGVEAVLVDVKKIREDFGLEDKDLTVDVWSRWYGNKGNGMVAIEATMYSGGRPVTVGDYDFDIDFPMYKSSTTRIDTTVDLKATIGPSADPDSEFYYKKASRHTARLTYNDIKRSVEIKDMTK